LREKASERSVIEFTSRNDVSAQVFIASGIFAIYYGHIPDGLVLAQLILNISQLNANTSDLDL
jgi:hypothetical protein